MKGLSWTVSPKSQTKITCRGLHLWLRVFNQLYFYFVSLCLRILFTCCFCGSEMLTVLNIYRLDRGKCRCFQHLPLTHFNENVPYQPTQNLDCQWDQIKLLSKRRLTA